jgi:hypothetical protein
MTKGTGKIIITLIFVTGFVVAVMKICEACVQVVSIKGV